MRSSFLLLVRRTPYHSCVAHVVGEKSSQSIYRRMHVRLLRVTPDKGVLPDVSDLIGRTFTKRELRQAIINKMRELEHVSHSQA